MAFGVFEVHAGDFKPGKDHQFIAPAMMTKGQLVMKTKGKFRREKIAADQIDTIESATEESVKRLGGSLGWGAAGALILGPVGLLAGLLGGGKGSDVTFVCQLKDGRKFMATANKKVYMQLSAAAFK